MQPLGPSSKDPWRRSFLHKAHKAAFAETKSYGEQPYSRRLDSGCGQDKANVGPTPDQTGTQVYITNLC